MSSEIQEELQEAGLIYTNDTRAGYYRQGNAPDFNYVDKSGSQVTDEKILTRIKKLVIPPAWQKVWIAKSPNAYLQVTGFDAKGRKQYRYHPEWTRRRSDKKYFRLLDFGKALPRARKQVAKDLLRRKFDQTKVLAICVDLMQKSLIRVGNESYKIQNGSFGLSTLRNKHATIKGANINLKFVGKKGVKQDVKLSDRRLAALLKKCRELPGHDLFSYYAEDGTRHTIDSTQINSYIKHITGGDFTAKDFRTWGATLEALRQMAVCYHSNDERPVKKIINDVLDCVACKLGNTRTVCRSSYVYPLLLEAFENNQMEHYLKQLKHLVNTAPADDHRDEKVLMKFLKGVAAA